MGREFLQLAHKFEPAKHSVAGWFWSEKLDGQRAWWDGGCTRGIPAEMVPWANVEKHGRFRHQVVSTGLWSRYGQVVRAPDWWLDLMPKAPFDGELYAGRGNFQLVESTVKEHVAGDGWSQIQYLAFGMPSYTQVFQTGAINNTNFKKVISLTECLRFIEKRIGNGHYCPADSRMFQDTYTIMKMKWADKVGRHEPGFNILLQEQLPFGTDAANAEVERVLNVITDLGGEGVILQKPEAVWHPSRMHSCLKVKRLQDSEATVVGYVTGRATDKGSKLLGLMGALVVDWEGKRFELSGFTDAERALGWSGSGYTDSAYAWAAANPETECPSWIHASAFPRGSQVTFRYRELTDDGIPKEARYFRKRGEE